MADEVNEGTAYLRALKQATGAPSGAGAAAAPARAQDHVIDNSCTVQGSESFQGAEKRRSPRYKCEGGVQLREEGCDVRTWSTFTDISLNGCYVEAQATYPAGTLLHMKLEANGIRVEIKGKVRISYPYLGMGIAFEEISNGNAAHPKQLLASLSRPRVIMGPGVNSPHPSSGPMESLPLITHPEAAVRAVIEFFEIHQILMRDDFVKLWKKSQQ
jgi:PilZ domain